MISVSPFKKPVFMLPCPPVGAVMGRICSKRTYDRIMLAAGGGLDREALSAILSEIAPDADIRAIGITGTMKLMAAYREAVEKYCEDNIGIFGLPKAFGMDGGEECRLPVITYGERLVYEHSGLSFDKIAELDILDFRMLLADAVKYRVLNRSDGKGREFLNECYDFMHRRSTLFE